MPFIDCVVPNPGVGLSIALRASQKSKVDYKRLSAFTNVLTIVRSAIVLIRLKIVIVLGQNLDRVGIAIHRLCRAQPRSKAI